MGVGLCLDFVGFLSLDVGYWGRLGFGRFFFKCGFKCGLIWGLILCLRIY